MEIRRKFKLGYNELRLLDYSIELKIITSDERMRKKLMKYFIELSKINVNDGKNIEWPEKPNWVYY